MRFEHRAAVQAYTSNASNDNFDGQDIALLACRIISRSAVDCSYSVFWKCLRVEASGGLGGLVLSNANLVFRQSDPPSKRQPAFSGDGSHPGHHGTTSKFGSTVPEGDNEPDL
jgi:hypothetical protein